MEAPAEFVSEMNEYIWNGFKKDVEDLTPDEADWRPLPQANSINVIVRHLRIEAEWHRASLERGEVMPSEVTPGLQQAIDSVPLDLARNLKELEEIYDGFLGALRRTTLSDLQAQTARAYPSSPEGRPCPPHFLGFHQALHLGMHWGRIRTIRNLYLRTRGLSSARFFPDNPTYPK